MAEQPKQSAGNGEAKQVALAPTTRAGFSDAQGFELAQRVAKALSQSTLVPPDYRGNLPNCIIALDMANRLGASALQVMQNLYVVHGRPGWSAKFLIASFNQCGRFSSIRYEWISERGKDAWGCKAWATELKTGQRIEGPTITIELAKKEGWYAKSGSKWQTIPELMLMYRSAGWLVNTHAPEISMGLNTAEELEDIELLPDATGKFALDSAAAAEATAGRQAALRNRYSDGNGEAERPGEETGEVASDDQIARINTLIDQIDQRREGAGMDALAAVTGGVELDALTAKQATDAEAALVDALAQMPVAEKDKAKRGQQELV